MLNVYGIYDEKALCYSSPFTALTDGLAKRMFLDLCNDPRTIEYKHSGDFKLYALGEFNTSTGEFFTHVNPVWLATGRDDIVHEQTEMTE